MIGEYPKYQVMPRDGFFQNGWFSVDNVLFKEGCEPINDYFEQVHRYSGMTLHYLHPLGLYVLIAESLRRTEVKLEWCIPMAGYDCDHQFVNADLTR